MANHHSQANMGMWVAAPGASAGHHSDMQLMMRDLDNLSTYLQKNREEWLQVQEGLARVERMHGRLARESLQNGDGAVQPPDLTSPEDPNQNPTTISSLQTALSQAQIRIADLETTYTSQQKLQSLYEDSLSETTERIRNYVYNQQSYLTSIHKNYATLLETARYETVQAQLTHQAWQEGLKNVSEKLREAVRSREEEGRPYRARIAALKSENRVLRKMVGWEPPAESEDEEDEADGGAAGTGQQMQGAGQGEESRGRGSRGGVGGGLMAAPPGGNGY